MKKTVVYAATRNLYKNVLACMNSALLNGNIDEVCLLIEDDQFPTPLPENVYTINVSGQSWFDRNGPNATKRWTYMVLMKAALSKLFPWYDKVLFLDCDTIVAHDLSVLWEIDLTGNYYAAVPQRNDGRYGAFTTGPYFNTGVLMCNLAELRVDEKDNELIAALNAQNFEFCEQDAIVRLCQYRIYPLLGRYNVCKFTVPDTETYILHFAANGGWVYSNIFAEYANAQV